MDSSKPAPIRQGDFSDGFSVVIDSQSLLQICLAKQDFPLMGVWLASDVVWVRQDFEGAMEIGMIHPRKSISLFELARQEDAQIMRRWLKERKCDTGILLLVNQLQKSGGNGDVKACPFLFDGDAFLEGALDILVNFSSNQPPDLDEVRARSKRKTYAEAIAEQRSIESGTAFEHESSIAETRRRSARFNEESEEEELEEKEELPPSRPLGSQIRHASTSTSSAFQSAKSVFERPKPSQMSPSSKAPPLPLKRPVLSSQATASRTSLERNANSGLGSEAPIKSSPMQSSVPAKDQVGSPGTFGKAIPPPPPFPPPTTTSSVRKKQAPPPPPPGLPPSRNGNAASTKQTPPLAPSGLTPLMTTKAATTKQIPPPPPPFPEKLQRRSKPFADAGTAAHARGASATSFAPLPEQAKRIRFGYLRKPDKMNFWIARLVVFDSRQRSLIYASFDRSGALMPPEHISFERITRVQLSVLSPRQFEIDEDVSQRFDLGQKATKEIETHRFLCDDEEDAQEWIEIIHSAAIQLADDGPVPDRPGKPAKASTKPNPPPLPPKPKAIDAHARSAHGTPLYPPTSPMSTLKVSSAANSKPVTQAVLPASSGKVTSLVSKWETQWIADSAVKPVTTTDSLGRSAHTKPPHRKAPPPPDRPPYATSTSDPQRGTSRPVQRWASSSGEAKSPPPPPPIGNAQKVGSEPSGKQPLSNTPTIVSKPTGVPPPPPPPLEAATSLSLKTPSNAPPPPPLPAHPTPKPRVLDRTSAVNPSQQSRSLNSLERAKASPIPPPPPPLPGQAHAQPTPRPPSLAGKSIAGKHLSLPRQAVKLSPSAAARQRRPKADEADFETLRAIHSAESQLNSTTDDIPVWMLPRSSRPREAPEPPQRKTKPGFYNGLQLSAS